MAFAGARDGCGDGGDLAVLDEDGLVFDGCGAGAVDDADVGEEDLRGVDFDVAQNVGGEGLGLEGCDGQGEGEDRERGEAGAHAEVSGGMSLSRDRV